MNPSTSALLAAANSDAMPKKLITKEEWERELASIEIDKEVMNKWVMDYILIEGYADTAEKFSLESETQQIDLVSTRSRMLIKKAMEKGRVEEAIQLLNDLNPEILDTNPLLFFHLQLQKFIEVIHRGEHEKALKFSHEELVPLVEENPNFTKELEETLSLLCFCNATTCPLKWLLDQAQRDKRANEVNAAILTREHHDGVPKLETLLKMLEWADRQLLKTANFPSVADLSEATGNEPQAS